MSREDALKTLTEGYHKTALALREVSVKQETCQSSTHARIRALEQAVHTGSFSISSRMAVLEARMAIYEKARNGAASDHTTLMAAKVGSKATVTAAWIGGILTFVVAVISLVITLKS